MGSGSIPDFTASLLDLARRDVELIVVGGVAGVLHGAPLDTFDLDVVHQRTPENLDRLMAALGDLEAFYRDRPGQRVYPAKRYFEGPGHHFLATKHGPLDVLGTIGDGLDYDRLLPTSRRMEIETDVVVRVIDLPTLIQVKEAAGRDKDKVALLVLRNTLAEIERRAREAGPP